MRKSGPSIYHHNSTEGHGDDLACIIVDDRFSVVLLDRGIKINDKVLGTQTFRSQAMAIWVGNF